MARRKPTGKTYTFTTVKDIVEQLSADQIDDFLTDFGTFLRYAKTGKSGDKQLDKLMKGLSEFVGTIAELTGEKVKGGNLLMSTDRFMWNDDGERHVKNVNIGVQEGGKFKTAVKFTMPKRK